MKVKICKGDTVPDVQYSARKLVFQLVHNPLLDHCLGSGQCWSRWKPRCPTNLTSGIWRHFTATISNIISSVWLCTNQVSRIEKTNERDTEMQKKASMQMNRRTAPTFPTNECDIQVNDIEADDTPAWNASLQKYLPISAASRLAGSPRLGFKKWLSDWPSQHPSFKTKLFWELHHCAKESLLTCWLSSGRRAVCAANFLDLLECKAL